MLNINIYMFISTKNAYFFFLAGVMVSRNAEKCKIANNVTILGSLNLARSML